MKYTPFSLSLKGTTYYTAMFDAVVLVERLYCSAQIQPGYAVWHLPAGNAQMPTLITLTKTSLPSLIIGNMSLAGNCSYLLQ